METLFHESHYVALNRTIDMALNAKDPFVANCILSWQRRNKVPCAIFKKGIKLKVHCTASMGAFGSHDEAGGFLEIRFNGGGGKKCFG